jgi:hypothetical protein
VIAANVCSIHRFKLELAFDSVRLLRDVEYAPAPFFNTFYGLNESVRVALINLDDILPRTALSAVRANFTRRAELEAAAKTRASASNAYTVIFCRCCHFVDLCQVRDVIVLPVNNKPSIQTGRLSFTTSSLTLDITAGHLVHNQ